MRRNQQASGFAAPRTTRKPNTKRGNEGPKSLQITNHLLVGLQGNTTSEEGHPPDSESEQKMAGTRTTRFLSGALKAAGFKAKKKMADVWVRKEEKQRAQLQYFRQGCRCPATSTFY